MTRLLFVIAMLMSTPGIATALDSDPFVYDSAFHAGWPIDERFDAAPFTVGYYDAQKLVKLADGDVIVAGVVPAYLQSAQGNGLYNVGLVRYSPSGARQAWSNPTPAYASIDHTYLTYPQGNGRYTAVRDIKVMGGYIYVLADYQSPAGNSDVHILVFGQDGTYWTSYGAFNTGLNESGAGMAVYSIPNCNGILACSRMIVFATYLTGSARSVITAKKYAQDNSTSGPQATLQLDTTFGPFSSGVNDYTAPDSSCASGSNCSVRAAGVSVVNEATGSPRVYVGAEFLWQNQNRDPAVAAIHFDSGDLVATFGNGGFSWQAFNWGSTLEDTTIGIAASTQGATITDEIYMVSRVQMQCSTSTGIGVLKLNAQGALMSSFGSGGKVVFGGDNNPGCSSLGTTRTRPLGIALDGSRLMIAGDEGSIDPPPVGASFDPLLAIVRTADGIVTESRTQRAPRSGGGYWGSGGAWNGVIANGAGQYTVAGHLVDLDASQPLFGTTRFTSDRIFGDGFDP